MKRTYNDFRRITRSQTAAVVKLPTPQPLKRVKIESLYRGFDGLPNEVIEIIMKDISWHLDGVVRLVCKRWHDIIGRWWKRERYRDPVRLAIKYHSMTLLKWAIRSVDPQKWRAMFLEEEEWEWHCSKFVNLEAMKWLDKQAKKEDVIFLTKDGREHACRYGDLVFLKRVLKLHDVYDKRPTGPYDVMNEDCLIASCAGSGGLEKVEWVYRHAPKLKETEHLLRMCWREASEHGQLDIFKWVYSNLVPWGYSEVEYGEIALRAVMHGSKPVILEWFSEQSGIASMPLCHASFPQKAINDGKASALEWWWQKHNKDASKAFVLAPFDARPALRSFPVKYDVLNWMAEHGQLKVTYKWFLWAPQDPYDYVPVLECLWSHTEDKPAVLGEFRKTGPYRLFTLLSRAIRRQSLKMCKWLESHGFLQAGVLIEGDILRLGDIVRYARRSESVEQGEKVYQWWMTSGKACLSPAKQNPYGM